MLLLTDNWKGRKQEIRDHMIHWEHFGDVFMTSAVMGDGVDKLRVIVLFTFFLLLYFVCSKSVTCSESHDI